MNTPPAPQDEPVAVEWWLPSRLRPHAQAGRVPELSPGDYRALCEDIAARGITVPLEATPVGVLLDGRARLAAARQLGHPTVPVRVVTVDDEVEHMVLAALLRRQLAASQRAALVLDLDAYSDATADATRRARANLCQSPEVATLPPRGKTRDLAAGWAGASARTIQDAATVRNHDPELFEQIKAGQVAAHLAARRVRRRLRDTTIPDPGPLPDGPFELIYADPPWQLGNPNGPYYAPENHYPTQPTDQIAALKPPVRDDAILYLWAVNSLLPDALHVMQAWGFEYKTNLVWVKPSIRLGIWARNRHKLLLVGRRGNYPPPEPERRADSVIEAPCRAHSQKPDTVYELLETAHPAARKLELYARGTPRAGWITWGNEATQ